MPLTKQDLIDKTTAFAKAYKIPLSSIVVSAGGSMLMHGFKETTLTSITRWRCVNSTV